MRELERDPSPHAPARAHVAVIGRGRLGPVVAAALRDAGHPVTGPLGRRPDTAGADVVLLAVPDREIPVAAAAVEPGPVVGHLSGATSLAALLPERHARRLSVHPLMTVTAAGADLRGAGAAVDASDPETLALAQGLAAACGLVPVAVAAEDRAAYHAAGAVASNFLVTLEAAAETLAASAGLTREQLVPLVRATVENWAALGPERALTGPIARGDEVTVARQRDAVAERAPELLPLFDALTDATRALAARPAAHAA